jgi:predicted RNA-binding protein YlqC (UPF0109 family)
VCSSDLSKENESKEIKLNPEEMGKCMGDAVKTAEVIQTMIEETEELLKTETDPEIIEKLKDELADLKEHYVGINELAEFIELEEIEEITEKDPTK